MKLRNYITRWQEFHEWSTANRPDIVDDVEQLGDELRESISEYRSCTDPEQRQMTMETIKSYYGRIVEWHTQEIISKLEG